jgi:hypothetical protein
MDTPTQEERNWGMIAHLAAFAAFPLPVIGQVVGPLVVWLVRRDRSAFVADQAKEALNFNITMTLAGVVAIFLAFVLVGFLVGLVVFFYWLVMTIVAAVKASEGVAFRYPFALRLVR